MGRQDVDWSVTRAGGNVTVWGNGCTVTKNPGVSVSYLRLFHPLRSSHEHSGSNGRMGGVTGVSPAGAGRE